MYRVAKKTTKKTEFKCLKCPFCKVAENVDINSDAIKERGIFVECTAENKCMLMPFNAKYFYCVQYKSANEMTSDEIDAIINDNRMKYDIEQYRQSLKYLPASKRNKLVREFKQRLEARY